MYQALQIFEVLKNIGYLHNFSAGLIVGGKDVKEERERLAFMNIIVATPGRLLQHMDEAPDFDCSKLQILVLDEADRCLDMGFEPTMNAILENIPKTRQTLLFSATQTKSVRDLARLSLRVGVFSFLFRIFPEFFVHIFLSPEPRISFSPRKCCDFYPSKIKSIFYFCPTERKN